MMFASLSSLERQPQPQRDAWRAIDSTLRAEFKAQPFDKNLARLEAVYAHNLLSSRFADREKMVLPNFDGKYLRLLNRIGITALVRLAEATPNPSGYQTAQAVGAQLLAVAGTRRVEVLDEAFDQIPNALRNHRPHHYLRLGAKKLMKDIPTPSQLLSDSMKPDQLGLDFNTGFELAFQEQAAGRRQIDEHELVDAFRETVGAVTTAQIDHECQTFHQLFDDVVVALSPRG